MIIVKSKAHVEKLREIFICGIGAHISSTNDILATDVVFGTRVGHVLYSSTVFPASSPRGALVGLP